MRRSYSKERGAQGATVAVESVRLRIRVAPTPVHPFARAQHADTHFPAQAALVHELPIELAPFEFPARTLEVLAKLKESTLRAAR
jgi:hypothetical protein